MRLLRAFLLWPAIALLTLLFGVPAIFAAFLPPRGDWFLRFARGWARSILAIAGIRVRLLHDERLRPDWSCVIVSNHESFCDILVLLARLPMQVRFLAKRSVFRVPILGWSIGAAGFIPVDRGDRTRSLATVEAALERLEGGRCVVVFPEETRTRTGGLLPFKKGAALLALRSGLPMLPIGLAGTFRILPRGSLLMASGRVVLCVGEPIPVTGRPALDRGDLTQDAKRAVRMLRDEAAAELRGEEG